MQSSEQRADDMLRAAGGSMAVWSQRNVLIRMILAEDRAEELERALDIAESVAQMAASDRDEALENVARAERMIGTVAQRIDCAWSAQCGECLNAAHALLADCVSVAAD